MKTHVSIGDLSAEIQILSEHLKHVHLIGVVRPESLIDLCRMSVEEGWWTKDRSQRITFSSLADLSEMTIEAIVAVQAQVLSILPEGGEVGSRKIAIVAHAYREVDTFS